MKYGFSSTPFLSVKECNGSSLHINLCSTKSVSMAMPEL